MVITPQTTIHSLLSEHPFLKDFLTAYNPEFKKLANPVLRRTMGRMATLERAADMAGVPLEQMEHDIAAEVERVTGVKPEVRAVAGFADVDQARQAELKAIVKELHAGASPDDLKGRFDELIEDVDATEIAAMEQSAHRGGHARDEVQRLCDVHVQVFDEALDEHEAVQAPAGHPVDTYMRENRRSRQILVSLRKVSEAIGRPARRDGVGEARAGLPIEPWTASREFDVTTRARRTSSSRCSRRTASRGPTKVMWALDDDIRGRRCASCARPSTVATPTLAALTAETLAR